MTNENIVLAVIVMIITGEVLQHMQNHSISPGFDKRGAQLETMFSWSMIVGIILTEVMSICEWGRDLGVFL
jgi:Na+/glutamate symporter